MLDGVFLAVDVLLQNGVDVDLNFGGGGLLGGGISTFVATLVVGAILIALWPEYTERMVAEVLEDPIASFLYGFATLLLLLLVSFVLVLTIIGILVVIPLLVLAYLVWVVGATIAFLAIGDRLVGRADGWGKPLLVAAGINGGLALTGVGWIISFVAGSIGFGLVLREFFA